MQSVVLPLQSNNVGPRTNATFPIEHLIWPEPRSSEIPSLAVPEALKVAAILGLAGVPDTCPLSVSSALPPTAPSSERNPLPVTLPDESASTSAETHTSPAGPVLHHAGASAEGWPGTEKRARPLVPWMRIV
jgi:hypothetical protein